MKQVIRHMTGLATKIVADAAIYPSLRAVGLRRTQLAAVTCAAFIRSCRLPRLNYVDSRQFQRNLQRALNRCESHHKLVRAAAYANGGKLRVRTDQEQEL
jgi:TnpA family transposase